MMKARLRTFKANRGDCIFFQLWKKDRQFNIMIDCGKFTGEIKDFVETELKNHINLLIVTHIDNDHIDGVCEMLEKIPELTVDRIFYNCCQKVEIPATPVESDFVEEDIKKLKANLPSRVVETNSKISIQKASVLAEQILKSPTLNKVWEKDYVHCGRRPYNLGCNFGKIIFVSPRECDIETMDRKFVRAYLKFTKNRVPHPHFEGKEVLYELVSKLILLKEKNGPDKRESKVAIVNFYSQQEWEKAICFIPGLVSAVNAASIAFIWEYRNKRVLFMGDSDPKTVADSIRSKYRGKLKFEAIQVSHHGSRNNTNKDLVSCIESQHYFITGGNKNDRPSVEAIAKIVSEGAETHKTIHYNNDINVVMKDLGTPKTDVIRKKYNFEITDKNEYEFEY